VRIFDASLARANTNPKKIYCIDNALVTSVSSGILVNSGHLLENLVFITLRRITPDHNLHTGRAQFKFYISGLSKKVLRCMADMLESRCP